MLQPKYNVGENVIIETLGCITFGKILCIRIYFNPEKIVYQIEGGREFSEDKIRLAVIESLNEKSRFYSLYPFI